MKRSIINYICLLSLFFLTSCGLFNKDQYSVRKQYYNSESVEIGSRERPIKIENNALLFKESILTVEFDDLKLKSLMDCEFIWPSLFATGEINKVIKSKKFEEMTYNEKLLYETTRTDSLFIFVEYVKSLSSKNKRVLKLRVNSPNFYNSRIYFAVYERKEKESVFLDEECQDEILIEFKYFGIEL